VVLKVGLVASFGNKENWVEIGEKVREVNRTEGYK
jgi:hypothetical protein